MTLAGRSWPLGTCDVQTPASLPRARAAQLCWHHRWDLRLARGSDRASPHLPSRGDEEADGPTPEGAASPETSPGLGNRVLSSGRDRGGHGSRNETPHEKRQIYFDKELVMG